MADQDDIIEIPSEGVKYVCSHCGKEFSKYMACQRHTQVIGTTCRSVSAKVKIIMTQEALSQASDESVPEEIEAEDEEVTPPVAEIPAPSSRESIREAMPSMAERSASSPLPSWAEEIDLSDFGTPLSELDLPPREVDPIAIRAPQASLQIHPQAWLVTAYEAFVREGYVGSMTDWVHVEIEYLFALLGIKIEILGIPADVREGMLQKVGLRDASH